MKRIIFLLVAVATLAGVIAFKARASHHSATQEAAPIFVTQIPDGYRDWRLVSVAHEEGNLNSFASILGNDIAIKAYREGRLPFPDGAIIAALHYRFIPSAENNKAFGRDQSFVAGLRQMFNLWSKTQRSTPRPAVGVSVISTATGRQLTMRS